MKEASQIKKLKILYNRINIDKSRVNDKLNEYLESPQQDFSIPKDKYNKYKQGLELFSGKIKTLNGLLGAVYISILYGMPNKYNSNNKPGLAKVVRNNRTVISGSVIGFFKKYFSDYKYQHSILSYLEGEGCLRREETKNVSGKKGVLKIDDNGCLDYYGLHPSIIKMEMEYYFSDMENDLFEAHILGKMHPSKKRKLDNHFEKVKPLILKFY